MLRLTPKSIPTNEQRIQNSKPLKMDRLSDKSFPKDLFNVIFDYLTIEEMTAVRGTSCFFRDLVDNSKIPLAKIPQIKLGETDLLEEVDFHVTISSPAITKVSYREMLNQVRMTVGNFQADQQSQLIARVSSERYNAQTKDLEKRTNKHLHFMWELSVLFSTVTIGLSFGLWRFSNYDELSRCNADLLEKDTLNMMDIFKCISKLGMVGGICHFAVLGLTVAMACAFLYRAKNKCLGKRECRKSVSKELSHIQKRFKKKPETDKRDVSHSRNTSDEITPLAESTPVHNSVVTHRPIPPKMIVG